MGNFPRVPDNTNKDQLIQAVVKKQGILFAGPVLGLSIGEQSGQCMVEAGDQPDFKIDCIVKERNLP